MADDLSDRLRAIVEALPLRPGLRVIEIGCGPGAMARAIAQRVTAGAGGRHGHVLGLDRSAKAIAQASALCGAEIAAGLLSLRQVAAEDFLLEPGEAPYDLAVAIRVGAFDGRHPEAGRQARARIAAALVPGGRLLIDGGTPLRDVDL